MLAVGGSIFGWSSVSLSFGALAVVLTGEQRAFSSLSVILNRSITKPRTPTQRPSLSFLPSEV
jgi:hypothetical protein